MGDAMYKSNRKQTHGATVERIDQWKNFAQTTPRDTRRQNLTH